MKISDKQPLVYIPLTRKQIVLVKIDSKTFIISRKGMGFPADTEVISDSITQVELR